MGIPVHIALMVTTTIAYGIQSMAPKVAIAAGARMNAAVMSGQWHHGVARFPPRGCHTSAEQPLQPASAWDHSLSRAWSEPSNTLPALWDWGNLAGLAFGSPQARSVGASGASFGMMGAAGALYCGTSTLGTYGDMVLTNVGQVLLLNLFIGCRRGSGIDNLAHVGGFVSGAIMGILLAPSAGGRTRSVQR